MASVLLWSYILWPMVLLMMLLWRELWAKWVAGRPITRKRVVSSILGLFYQPFFLVFVLVVLVGEVTASYELKASEDHDVTQAIRA
jgi:hypothetical protein